MSNLRVDELESLTTGRTISVDDIDTDVRQDLTNPDKGAAMVARGVVAVDSIADLLALPEEQRKEELRYLVKGYYAGAEEGGGEFYWDPASTADDNGGTVFSGGDVSGRWLRVVDGETLHLEWFGPKQGQDSSAQLNRFFEFAKSDGHGFTDLEAGGSYQVSTVTRIDIRGFTTANFSLKLTAIADMVIICAMTTYSCNCAGSIEVTGNGTNTDWYSQGCQYGIALQGIQLSVLPALSANRIAFWGVVIVNGAGLDTYGNPLGGRPFHNNSQAQIPKIRGSFCGGINGTVSYNLGKMGMASEFTNPVNTGGVNSYAQRTTITVATPPPASASESHNPKYAVIDGKTYIVTALTGDQVELFPWLPSSVAAGEIQYLFGGLFLTTGSDSNLTDLGQVDAANCVVVVRDRSFYGVNARSVASHYVAIVLGIGWFPSDVGPQGSTYVGVYTEDRFRDVVHCGTGSAIIYNRGGNFSGSFARCEEIDSADLSGVPSGGRGFSKIAIRDNTSFTGSYHAGRARNGLGGNLSISPEDIIPKVIKTNSFTIKPRLPGTNVNELYGLHSAQLTIIGTGANGTPTGNITIGADLAVAAGWTVNGSEENTVFSDFTGPPTFIFYWEYATKDVKVFYK